MEDRVETIGTGTWPPIPDAKKIIFYDRQAGLDAKDVKTLEDFGYTVIGVDGTPQHVLSFIHAY